MNSTLKAVAAALSLAATSAFAVVDGKIHSFSASPNPAAVGQPVSMIATINFEDIKPKGTTAYYDGGTVIPGCEALPYDSSGNAQRCVHAFDTAGTHHLTATYSGDTTYPSSSATQDLVVQEGKWTPTFDIFNSDDPDGNAVRIGGEFLMYLSEGCNGTLQVGRSRDLIHWTFEERAYLDLGPLRGALHEVACATTDFDEEGHLVIDLFYRDKEGTARAAQALYRLDEPFTQLALARGGTLSWGGLLRHQGT